MSAEVRFGPEREQTVLLPWESDAFTLLVENSTYSAERFQLSYALRIIYRPQCTAVQDAFQGNARRIWRTATAS